MMRALLVAFMLLLSRSAIALAEDLYEEYHGGFGSGLFRGFPVKLEGFGSQP